MVAALDEKFVHVATLTELKKSNFLSVVAEKHTLVLFNYDGQVYAVDNRCPHMGFPLDKGSIKDGILTCYWHYARFDIQSGGTFDQWADDVRVFPVEVRGEDIWVNLAEPVDPRAHHLDRLRIGLERNIPLVIAKAVIYLLHGRSDPAEPFRAGLAFGTRYRQDGWAAGLTILACMVNLLPYLEPIDRPRALYHGLSAVANDTDGMPPRFMVQPLPTDSADIPTLKRWFRQFVEVRDGDGAERCLISALRAGAGHQQMADMLFAAATDHRYLTIGHVLDFTNKALEALDKVEWDSDLAESVLTSLVPSYVNADRMEESNAWRNPVDLVEILEETFKKLPDALAQGREKHVVAPDKAALVQVLLGDQPQLIADALLKAIREGVPAAEVAGVVSYAAALRIARFHTSNEFGDWDTTLHTFTFANAVQQGLWRVESAELVRGVFDAAMSIYLDRFLNIPAAPLPEKNGVTHAPETLLHALPDLLNLQQQVNPAGKQVAQYVFADGDVDQLLAMLGKLLLREDRNFHTIQSIEAAFAQYELLKGTPEAVHVLVAAARYLAAHTPTARAQGQTYTIAYRLHRGEKLFEE